MRPRAARCVRCQGAFGPAGPCSAQSRIASLVLPLASRAQIDELRAHTNPLPAPASHGAHQLAHGRPHLSARTYLPHLQPQTLDLRVSVLSRVRFGLDRSPSPLVLALVCAGSDSLSSSTQPTPQTPTTTCSSPRLLRCTSPSLHADAISTLTGTGGGSMATRSR
jgi:hypothetical protein